MSLELDLTTPAGITLALSPEIMLSLWSLVVMLVAGWRHRDENDQRTVGIISLVGLLTTLLTVIWLWVSDTQPMGLPLMIALDGYRYAADAVFLIAAILTVMMSLGYMGRERLLAPEYYLLILLATVGMMFMGGGSDLIVIFLGLELMSIPVYVLSAINRRSKESAEAGMKYFLLGAFASAFFLYGIALLYGSTGSTNLAVIDVQVSGIETAGATLAIGIGMLLIGLGFKVAAVPFHMWTPDVYDGAPTPVTAFMATGVKAAAFAALVRILIGGLGSIVVAWQDGVWWLAVVTMLAGNLIALAQRHLKRMLAYSSIAHAGYLLAAVVAGNEAGAGAVLFYVIVYTLMTVGAFAVLAAVGRDGERDVLVEDFAGLARTRPWLAFSMSVFMLSLLGFPGTAGFIGKWFILSTAVQGHQGWLAVVLVIASVISAGYYLPVIMAMYMKPGLEERQVSLAGASRIVVATAAIMILLLGFWPNRLLDLARRSGETLRPDMVLAQHRGP